MALVLSLFEGEVMYVDDTPITLVEVITPTCYRIKVEGPTLIQFFEINENQRIEVLPKVFMQAGRSKQHGDAVRIAIEAPRTRLILRDKLYQAQKKKKAS